jgi:bisanhydrobacterioruberin hydratase
VTSHFSKYQVATFIAVLFHVIGFTGIYLFKSTFIIHATPINLLLMFILLLWTQNNRNTGFWIFLLFCYVTGVAVEVIGVNTGKLFGDYEYGTVLGEKIMDVPLIIGINWFIIIYCSAVSIHTLLAKITRKTDLEAGSSFKTIKALSVIIDGATLAVILDWLIEPVAVRLDYWHWKGDGSIPFFNYLCWFLVSVLMLLIFHFCKFEKRNKFAVNLLLIQVMFFLLLRTFMA